MATFTFDEMVDHIASVLRGMDGKSVEFFANKILDGVKYVGDDIFECESDD